MGLMNWIPQFIREIVARQPRHVVTSTEYNELFNKVITQGDHNTEAIADVRKVIDEGDIVIGPTGSINWGNVYGIPTTWEGDLDWDDILEAIETTYIDANGVWTPNVYAQNIITSIAKISTAQIDELIVGENVQMGANASISWEQVNNPPAAFSEEQVQNLITQYGLSSEEVLQLLAANGMSPQQVSDLINGMISDGTLATSQELQDLAFKWADDVLALIDTTYIDANGVWTPNVYTNHIVAGTALIQDALIESISADKITGDIIVGQTVIINQLAASKATIAELTVDQLDTSDKVANYLAGNKADVNYIKTYDQHTEFITASVKAGDPTPTTQVTDRNSNPLYWVDIDRTGVTTDVTDYPVTIYDYTELTKLKVTFALDGETYVPRFEFGAGAGVVGHPEYGKGFIYKDGDGLVLKYTKADGTVLAFKLGENGIEGNSTSFAHPEHSKNTSIVSVVSASEVVAATKSVTIFNRSKVLVHFTCEITISGGACNLTAKTYVDGTALTYQPTLFCAGANTYVLSYHDFEYGVGSGTKTIAVKLQTDANTGSISIGHAAITIQVFEDPMPTLTDASNLTATAASDTQINLGWDNP